MLVGKQLFLRGGYLDNALSFNEHGVLIGHSPQGSYTLCEIQIDKVHLSKHKVELEGQRLRPAFSRRAALRRSHQGRRPRQHHAEEESSQDHHRPRDWWSSRRRRRKRTSRWLRPNAPPNRCRRNSHVLPAASTDAPRHSATAAHVPRRSNPLKPTADRSPGRNCQGPAGRAPRRRKERHHHNFARPRNQSPQRCSGQRLRAGL